MKWLVVSSKIINHYPEWKRTIGILNDGEVFVPAAIGGSEKKVSLSTLNTLVTVRIRHDHVYVPMVWLAESFPSSIDMCWVMGLRALSYAEKICTLKASKLTTLT